MTVLGFLELPEDDVPPELIWHHDERMKEWWDEVKAKRNRPAEPALEDVPTTDNELAEEYRRGR